MKKRFDKELFTQNDTLARAAGKKYWASQGYSVEDNADRYGPDLVVTTNDKEIFFSEVEIKKVWSGETFAYDTLQIPARKKKFLLLERPCMFIVFNNEQTHGFLCTHSELAASPLVEVSNKYVRAGEMFYQVPIDRLTLIEVPYDN